MVWSLMAKTICSIASEAVPLENSSFTVALWARPEQLDRPGVVFSSHDAETNAQLWLSFAATNQFLCGFTADSVLQSEILTDTDWHHWACTYELHTTLTGDDTVDAKLYRDGEVVDEHTFDRAFGYYGSGDWWIGGGYGDSGTPSHFGGTLDELVVAPAALNEREINLLMEGRYHTNERQFLAAPGDTLTYQATLENNLMGRTLTGLLALDAPADWESTNRLAPIQLGPAEKEVLAGTLAVADTTGSGTYSLTLIAGAAASAPIALPTSAVAAETEPAVHYTFDDKSLRFAPASQATQKAGSLNFAAGIGSGNALSLDGRSVFEVNNNAFDLSNTPFTYALWVKPDAGANGTRAILGQPPSGRDWEYNAGGIYLEIQDGTDLLFGWGDEWTTDPIANVFTPNAWTHILITYDQKKLTVYVNGVEREQFTPGGKPPLSRPLLSIGDENYCGEFALGQVHTIEEDDGPGSAEYGYVFVDENGTETFLLYDDDADSDEWEPGSETYFNDKYQTFCLTGARVYAYEDDGGDEHKFDSDDDGMYPDVRFDFTTPEQEGLKSPEISGDGRIEFYYDISNPVLPFKGSIDDLRLYRRALNEGEAQQLYESASVPYHYALDEPPGADLADTLASDFNFANEGAIADPRAQGICDISCPTSGVPGRVNRAVLFHKDAGEGIRIHQLTLPQAAPGFSLWVKPETLGVFFGLNTEANGSVASLFYDAENHFCLAQAAQSVCSTTAYPVGQWVHTMLTFANQELILHLNNSERVMLSTVGAAWPGAGVYSIHLGGTNFGGMLDDLRIPYDGSDVTAMYQSAPIVSLHFDETTSATIAFDNGGGVNAPCAGSTCPATQRRGKVDRAVAFDGIDDGLIMPASDALNLDHFTLATWVNPAASANADALYPLIAKNAGDERNYALYLTEELTVVATRNCAAAGELLQVTSKEPIPLNEYTHIAATYDGSIWHSTSMAC
ncbi:MAG: LamG domain-containing protein [Caldilineaceae bacterium]